MFEKFFRAITSIAVLATMFALSGITTMALGHEDDDIYDYYDKYDWYSNEDYDYDWKSYDWSFDEPDPEVDIKAWTEGDWEGYWENYEWEEEEWEDMGIDYYDLYYEVEELLSLIQEVDMLYEEYNFVGVVMPAEIDQGLQEVESKVLEFLENEKLAPLYDVARDAIKATENYDDFDEKDHLAEFWKVDYSADLEMLLEGIWEFWDHDPWKIIDYAWETLHGHYFEEDIREKIAMMLEDLEMGAAFVRALASLEIDSPAVKQAIENLKPLIPEAKATLQKMLELVEQGVDVYGDDYQDSEFLDSYWEILDRLGEIFFNKMEIVMEYFDRYPEKLAELEKLVPEEAAMIFASMEEPLRPENSFDEDFEKYYGKITLEVGEDFAETFASKVSEADHKKIMKGVSAQMMKELAKYFEDEVAQGTITNVMNYMEVLGEEMTKTFLANQSDILKKVDFNFEKAGNLRDKLEDLHKRTKMTIVPDKFKKELGGALGNLRDLVEFGVSEEKLSDAINRVMGILDEIDNENIFGENAIEFYDVPFNSEEEVPWYWRHVTDARKNGIIGGYTDEEGKLTGYFGPGNQVTYAEALKMTMEAAGYGYDPSPGSEGPWYQGYLDKVDELNLGRLDSGFTGNWNIPAPRGDILLMVNEIWGIAPVEYVNGTFPDVKSDDSLANDTMASYLAGIFTGHGETGELRPNDFIDRASFAKVISKGLTYFYEQNFVDELSDFRSILEQ